MAIFLSLRTWAARRSRSAPDRAGISISTTALKSVNIVMFVAEAGPAPQITPEDPLVAMILVVLRDNPEFVLSRRELIRYVLSTPGKRSEKSKHCPS